MGGVPKMDPSKQIKYSGLPSRLSNSKWFSEIIVDKYTGNESLLTRREINTQIVLIIVMAFKCKSVNISSCHVDRETCYTWTH